MFGTPDNFLEMVRTAYPVVYRPVTVTFLKAKAEAREIVQPVKMTDAKGGSWLAVYRVQRQKDKSWRIAGCALVAERGQVIATLQRGDDAAIQPRSSRGTGKPLRAAMLFARAS